MDHLPGVLPERAARGLRLRRLDHPARRRAARRCCTSALLVVSLACLPILASSGWKPQGDEEPILRILLLLGATIGLPYFLLSTTTPLLQAWYWRRFRSVVPYRLFALSNLASLLALLGFPVLFEPAFDLKTLAWALVVSVRGVRASLRGYGLAFDQWFRSRDQVGRAGRSCPSQGSAAVARARGDGLGDAARGHQPRHAEHLERAVPVGAAARAVSHQLHPRVRPSALV